MLVRRGEVDLTNARGFTGGRRGKKKEGNNMKRNIFLGKQENKAILFHRHAKKIKVFRQPKEPIPCTKKVRQPTVIYKAFLNSFIEEGCNQRKMGPSGSCKEGWAPR